jgi:tight adherence protein C
MRKRVLSISETPRGPLARKNLSPSAIASLGDLLVPKGDSRRNKTAALLRHADWRTEGAIRVFYGVKLAAMVLTPLLVLGVLNVALAMPLDVVLPYALVAAGVGYIAPDLLLAWFARRRQERLRRGLPDAMDLLVVCSEAGLSLSASIQRVASELSIPHPDLADELAQFPLQTRAGMDSRAALKDLEERTGLEDIQSLVTTLLQGMRFGTSIADTLRIYSDELRDKRLQRAQEQAARVGTLMLLPLMLCIMPSFFLVVLGPAVLGALAALSR